MMFDSIFQFVDSEKLDDGMGGYTETEIFGTPFSCHKTPVKVETLLKEYGLVSSKAFKLITKESINPNESLKLLDINTNDKYKIIDVLDYQESIYTIFLIGVI